jgi:hypothetical protein
MKQTIISIALLIGISYGIQRPEVIKIIKMDTITQLDTLKFIKYDTLKITKTFRDTSILVKQDTIIVPSKPIKLPKK